MMKPVVRLRGQDSEVREIGRAAVHAMRARPQAASALFARLWSIHQRRSSVVSAMSVQQPTSATPMGLQGAGPAFRALWGMLVGVGLTAALISAVMFGPSDRKNAFLDPTLAGAVAIVAGTIGIPALLIALMLRVPDQQSARTAVTLSVLVGLVCAGMLVFRTVAESGDERGFATDAVARWVPMTALTLLLIIALAVRSGGAARPSRSDLSRGEARRRGR